MENAINDMESNLNLEEKIKALCDEHTREDLVEIARTKLAERWLTKLPFNENPSWHPAPANKRIITMFILGEWDFAPAQPQSQPNNSWPITDKVTDQKGADPNSYDDWVRKQKAYWANEPKVQINIPLDPGEQKWAVQTVSVNWAGLTIMKWVFVQVPQSVANIIAERYDLELWKGNHELENKYAVKNNPHLDTTLSK